MVRWYDYIAAFIAADAILMAGTLALFGPTFWAQFLGAMMVSLFYDLWIGLYCRLRRESEQSS
jgi:hypothetical protein